MTPKWSHKVSMANPGWNQAALTGLITIPGMAVRQAPADSHVQCMPLLVDGVPGEWILAPGADPDVRLLYLHGGGYVSGTGAHYAAMAAEISAAARCAVLLLDYRLAPEHPFPAAIEDCCGAHEWLLNHGPTGPGPARTTFIAGDSAGGGLVLAALLALRDRARPLPAAGIALSAFADLTLTSPSLQSEAKNDPIMSPLCLPTFVDLYLAETDPRDPLASPVLADFSGIPPLLIQVGQFEIIRDDSIRVAHRARSFGVDVELEVWPGMVHVFQVRELPESKQAIGHMAAFMNARASEG